MSGTQQEPTPSVKYSSFGLTSKSPMRVVGFEHQLRCACGVKIMGVSMKLSFERCHKYLR